MDSLATRIIVSVLVLAGLVSGCAEERPELTGSVYFPAGSYVAELDLRNGGANIVTSIGDDNIVELVPQGDDRLLLTVYGDIKGRDAHSLALYDIASKQVLPFFEGRKGRYLPGTDVLVYDDGRNILVKRKQGDAWETIEVDSHPNMAPVEIVPISDTAFLYSVGTGKPLLFDLATPAQPTRPALSDHCNLVTSLWVTELEAMLCRPRSTPSEHRFVTLDGTVSEALPLPKGRQLRAVSYAADQDIVLLTERWQSFVGERPKYAIWVHHRDTGRTYRLTDNQHLGNFVVYQP